MSIVVSSEPIAPIDGMSASDAGSREADGVVEINLLLPSQWADDLIALSAERQQTVGQILRSMIGHALHDRAVQT